MTRARAKTGRFERVEGDLAVLDRPEGDPEEEEQQPEPPAAPAPETPAPVPAPAPAEPEPPVVPEPDVAARLEDCVAMFREGWPMRWAELALCPLEHGLAEMASVLRDGRPEMR